MLFSDIAGFSKISENITPRELASLLNEYFTQMGDAIMSREGMINKYIGDAIMAIWGAPLPNEQHDVMACQAALDMKRLVAQMPHLHVRIGLSTGAMVAGNLGHQERMEYTVIGDAVNLASRLEGANKPFGTGIMVSEFTEELIRGHFITRQLDWIRVLGKEQPVRVFELMREAGNGVEARVLEMVQSYDAILDRYEKRDWAAACDLIEKHVSAFPEDPVVQKVYRLRCQEFLGSPPSEDWDGVYVLTSK